MVHRDCFGPITYSGLNKGQSPRKLTSCENDFAAFFGHLEESFFVRKFTEFEQLCLSVKTTSLKSNKEDKDEN